MLVKSRIREIGLERGLRDTTLRSYETLLNRLDLLDREVSSVSREELLDLVWTLDNVNTRRATVIAMRSVFGIPLKIPKGIPRRYDLPDEDTLRIALMTSPHEMRGLLMMYAGLRVGEACAVTYRDVHGDRLTVDKQVQQLHRTGRPVSIRIGPVKASEASVIVPHWLSERLDGYDRTDVPSRVRESLRRAGRKVGIHLNPHMLRHWYATTMIERGVPLSLVSKQMRHSDVAVTLRAYSEHKDSQIHDVFG